MSAFKEQRDFEDEQPASELFIPSTPVHENIPLNHEVQNHYNQIDSEDDCDKLTFSFLNEVNEPNEGEDKKLGDCTG